MALRTSQTEHDRMIRYLADFLRHKDFADIRASVNGFRSPEKIDAFEGQSFTPDLTGMGKQFHLFEVETEDTIFDEHCSREWTLFSRHATQKNGVFWVVIPMGCRGLANQRLMELDLDARVLEV